MLKKFLSIIFILCLAANVSAQLSFEEPVTYPVGYFPAGVVSADLNGDGKDDLITMNGEENKNISVLINKGDGTFNLPVNYPINEITAGPTVADFNGDGHLDLTVVGDSLYIFFNNGSGTFTLNKKYYAPKPDRTISVGDFNGDGKPDIAFTQWFLKFVLSVFINNGNGTFKNAVNYKATQKIISEFYSTASGDLNNDGKDDIVVPWDYGDSVSVYLSKGDGTFNDSVNYKSGIYPSSTRIVDIDGDGMKDIISSCNYTSTNNLSVLINNGSGFNLPVKYSYYSNGQHGHLITNDFNKDGKPDFAVTGGMDWDSLFVFLNDGTGKLIKSIGLKVDTYSYTIASGDFNNDGKPDLASPNLESFVSVFLQSTTTSLFSFESASQNNITVFPNPATTILTIEFKESVKEHSLLLYDKMGRLTKSINREAGTNTMQIDVSDLDKGMYWLRLEGEGSGHGYPVVVE